MKVLIDVRCVGKEIHGIARHGINIVKNIALLDTTNEYLLLVNRVGQKHFNNLPQNFQFHEVNINPYSISEQFLLPLFVKNFDFDVYYTPNYTAPLFLKVKFFFTIHDMIHLIFPDDYSFIHRVYYGTVIARLAKSARKIFTVSESSRKDIMKFFNVPEGKISVVYNGVDERFSPGDKEGAKNLIAKKYNIEGRFLLWVGNNKRHKNLDGAINAFKAIKKDYQNFKFVAVLNAKDNRKFSEDIFIVNVDNDDDLVAFYRSAEVAVLPSLYEGFCLPLLEAMACGCPVVSSNTSSIPEVAKASAILVNPESEDEIARGVIRIIEDKNIRGELIRKGIERSKRFTWQKTAKSILEVLTSPDQ